MEHEKINVFPEKGKNNDESYNNLRDIERIDLNTGEMIKKGEENSNTENKQTKSKKVFEEIDEIETYVEPDYDSDFDVIPLPSNGKAYKHGKKAIKVSFLNGSDENILTNPNLVKSGRFMDILLKRKIIDKNFKYEELVTGDKDVILLWLRGTSYGNDYEISAMDPVELKPFKQTIDLSEIPTKELEIEPDENGLFDFTLPVSKKQIKFRLLRVIDQRNIERYGEYLEQYSNDIESDLSSYALTKAIVSVDGNSDKEFIKTFTKKIRLGDSKAFKQYVEKIKPGKDFMLKLRAPGGGLVTTFFPINTSFFWPES